MDEMVRQCALCDFDGPSDLLHRFLVSGRDRSAEFFQCEERSCSGSLGQRLRCSCQADRARVAQEGAGELNSAAKMTIYRASLACRTKFGSPRDAAIKRP